jgi:uncharacterized protein YjbI with pentapeptide repeats
MKRFAIFFLSLFAIAPAFAQNAPSLKQIPTSDGGFVLNWPVQVLTNASTNLNACYQLERSVEIGAWAPEGPLLRGENFKSHIASVRADILTNEPASFFRVRAVFDFSGGNFIGKFIQDLPLTNSIWTGANLFGASLDGSSFDNGDLSAADCRFATMTEISATNADFTLARLSDADLTSANFQGASLLLTDLSGAKLNFADLSGTDLRGAILQENESRFTRLHNSTVDATTIFDRRSLAIWIIVNGNGANRIFTNVDLSFADLSGGNLQNANLNGVDLSGADLSNADLRGANLTNTVLRLLDLRGTQMDETTNITNKWRLIWDIINNPKIGRTHTNTDLSLGFWSGTMLQAANVRGSDFTGGLMSEVNLDGINGVGARFTNVEFHGTTFKSADLRSASFVNAFLDNVNFLGANIGAANFTGATFINTTMPDGSIKN